MSITTTVCVLASATAIAAVALAVAAYSLLKSIVLLEMIVGQMSALVKDIWSKRDEANSDSGNSNESEKL